MRELGGVLAIPLLVLLIISHPSVNGTRDAASPPRQERGSRMVPDFRPYQHPSNKLMEATVEGLKLAPGPISTIQWLSGMVPIFGGYLQGQPRSTSDRKEPTPSATSLFSVVFSMAGGVCLLGLYISRGSAGTVDKREIEENKLVESERWRTENAGSARQELREMRENISCQLNKSAGLAGRTGGMGGVPAPSDCVRHFVIDRETFESTARDLLPGGGGLWQTPETLAVPLDVVGIEYTVGENVDNDCGKSLKVVMDLRVDSGSIQAVIEPHAEEEVACGGGGTTNGHASPADAVENVETVEKLDRVERVERAEKVELAKKDVGGLKKRKISFGSESLWEDPEYTTKTKTFKITKFPKTQNCQLLEHGKHTEVVEVLDVVQLQQAELFKITIQTATADLSIEGANVSRLRITVLIDKNEFESLAKTMTIKEYMCTVANEKIAAAVRMVRTDCSIANIQYLAETIKKYRPESATPSIGI